MVKKKICTCPTTEKVEGWKAKSKILGPPAVKVHKADCILSPPNFLSGGDEEQLKKAKEAIKDALTNSFYEYPSTYPGTSFTAMGGQGAGIHPTPSNSYWDHQYKAVTSKKYSYNYDDDPWADVQRNKVYVTKEALTSLVEENANLKKRIERLEEIVLGAVEQETG